MKENLADCLGVMAVGLCEAIVYVVAYKLIVLGGVEEASAAQAATGIALTALLGFVGLFLYLRHRMRE